MPLVLLLQEALEIMVVQVVAALEAHLLHQQVELQHLDREIMEVLVQLLLHGERVAAEALAQ